MEMQKMIAREGRDAKNLLLYHLSSEDDLSQKTNVKKPPAAAARLNFRKTHLSESQSTNKQGPRVRSASTGRDKRSELQARYWALLFGNLQRAINEIYQTVECYENLASCQEAILVLENYIRDFRALAEWFRVSWDYEATPLPQRPHSLAWEVRKSNPAPRVRAKSLSTPSPNMSGKSSPCPSYSGKISPCSTIDDAKQSTSPRKKMLDIKANFALTSKPMAPDLSRNLKSPRMNIREFNLCKLGDSENHVVNGDNSTILPSENELSKIPEESQHMTWGDLVDKDQREVARNNSKIEQIAHSAAEVVETVDVITFDQYSQTSGFVDEYLTLQQWRDKYENCNSNGKQASSIIESAVGHTMTKLDEMENEFLVKNANKPSELIQTTVALSNQNEMGGNKENAIDNSTQHSLSTPAVSKGEMKPTHPDDKNIQSGAPLKYSNVVNRSVVTAKPAYPAKLPLHGRILNSKSATISTAKPLTTPNVFVNSNLTRKLPIKSASVLPPIKSKPVTQLHLPLKRDVNQVTGNTRSNTIPSNTATRLAARSKTMIDLGTNARQNLVHNKTLKSESRDSFNSSSSTLRASSDQISTSASNSQTKLNARRSEPRTMPARSENNDGWLTVKARRRTSLHWSNRFNQPSGYASLPTLALLNEKDAPNGSKLLSKKENKKPTKPVAEKFVKSNVNKPTSSTSATIKADSTLNSKLKTVASTSTDPKSKSKVQQTIPVAPVNVDASKVKPTKPIEKKPASIVSRATIFQRQKSDITGLKLNTLRKEYFRKEKNKLQNDSKKNEPESPIHATEQKVSMNIQTNMGLSSIMCDLYASCLEDESAAASGETNKRDIENDDTEEMESDENQRILLEEQECLERQILELQNTEIEIDTETDDPDCETILDLEESDSNLESDHCEDNMSLEARYQHLLSDMSSGERIETLATLQAFVSRYPGRAQELHQKLSSPSRRRSLHETIKKYQAKQARAQDMRENLNKEKALKLQTLLARVEDVKASKQQLIDEKRVRMEEKLQRYTENRNQFLKDKVRKAHDEEEKLKEIAFIKSLEAQNKRLDMMEMRKEQEGRLQDLEQERQKRMEEKAAKEAAVERRRLELAKERQKRLEKMDETRREREQRVEQMQEEKEKMRQKIARDKARDREERLLALQVQQQQTTEELQRKIIQKQQESARRHEENIEHIRQRALELSIPSRNVDENGTTRYESADRAGGIEDDLSSVVSDLSIEQTKASKRKLKKLRQRIAQLTEEYIASMDQVPAYMKRDSLVPKLLAIMRRGGGPQGMERPLGQLARIVAKPEVFDFQCLWLLDGLGVLANIIKSAIEPNSELTRKSLIMAVQVYRNSCSPCPQIARHAVLGNSISILFDALLHSLQTPDDKTPSHPIELSTELMLACTVVLSPFNTLKQPHPKVLERLPDLISYAVSIGLIDVLSRRCMKIREPIEIHQSVVLSILACLGLLTKFADVCQKDSSASKFLAVVKSTELFGAISLLYATIVPVGESIPPRTISIAAATFNLILTLANLDLVTFQSILSQEALSLQFLDVVTILLKYCGPKSSEKGETQAVIVDLVATLGFFCANNEKNQNMLIGDQSSVIIKSLSKLPKSFDIVVYPTLLTIICDNDGAKKVIGRDFDLKYIDEYQNSEMAKKNKMLSMLQSKKNDN